MSSKGSSKSPNKKNSPSKSEEDEEKSKSKKSSSSSSASSEETSDSTASKRAAHPPYRMMVQHAIFEDSGMKGTSRASIKKYILTNYKVDEKKANGYLAKALKGLIGDKVLMQGESSQRFKFTKKGRQAYKEETGRKSPKKRERKPKDPDAPKKPSSAWLFYSMAARKQVKKKHPDLSFGEQSKKVGNMWKHLDEEDKKKWEAMAVKDKKRYKKEMKEYKEKKGEDSSSESGSASGSESESETDSKKKKEKEKKEKEKKEKEKKEKEKEKEEKEKKEKEKKEKEKKGKKKDDMDEDDKEKDRRKSK